MESKNILIIQNTDFHLETAYSLYDSLVKSGFTPSIVYLPEKNKHSVENFFKLKNINFINSSGLDARYFDKNIFNYAFVVTSDFKISSTKEININLSNYNHWLVQLFKNKIILIHHRSFTPEKNKNIYASEFPNAKFLSVCPYSQKFGLNFINQTSYCFIKNSLDSYNPIKDVVNFFVIGRFNRFHNRNLNNLKLIIHNIDLIKKYTQRDFKIYIIGEKANTTEHSAEFIEKHSNLDETKFYSLLKESHFIFNFLKDDRRRLDESNYFIDTFSSNYTNSIGFQKPMIGSIDSFLTFPVPSIPYNDDLTFIKALIFAINIKEEDYKKMIENFDNIKRSHEWHNKNTLQNILI